MYNNNNNLAAWLVLIHTPKLNPTTALKILEGFSSPVELLATSREELLARGLSAELIAALQNPNWQEIEKSLAWTQQDHHHIITWQDAAYPELLKQTTGAPLLLYVRGNPQILATTQLAIVGSRNPTPTGLDNAYHFAQHLSVQGFTITSGLALGVDAASHQGALAGKGLTIAVMGTGLNQIYPARHKTLAQQIIDQGGLLVSEFPPDSLPKAEHFPRRNRVISGLSLGTLVVEAALQSGSLITAKFALEQGREVFAIPGSIHNPLARGCHALLKQGAKLVETADDILEEFKALSDCEALTEISVSTFLGVSKQQPKLVLKTLNYRDVGQPHGCVQSETQARLVQKAPTITLRDQGFASEMPRNALKNPDLVTKTSAWMGGEGGTKNCPKLDSQDAKLVECVGFETTSIDTLIERSGLGAEIVSARLLMLELQGFVSAVPGGYVRKTT